VSELERGLKVRPRLDTVVLLADALGLEGAKRMAFTEAARVRRSAAWKESLALLSVARDAMPPLVGRTRELALIDQHLAGDGPPVLLLTGEPGIGKSRLLAETAARARAAGWRVLAGGCVRGSGQAPFEPFVTLLAGALAATPPARLRLDLAGCAWLARLLPELLETTVAPAPGWTLPPEQERRLVFAAVARYLTNLADPAGTVLLLDDLQWAGADALDLLASLVSGPLGLLSPLGGNEGVGAEARNDSHLRVVGAWRSTEVDAQHPLAVLLADLARDRRARHELIGPLAESDARVLLTGLVSAEQEDRVAPQASPAVVERLVQRAGGIPYVLVSLAQSLFVTADDEAMVEAIPWDVGQSIRARVAVLAASVQQTLHAAAVVGRMVSHPLLATLMTQLGQSERELIGALESADQARLFIAAESAQAPSRGAVRAIRYQFAHELVRDVILADLSAPRRVWLHRHVAEALERVVTGLPEIERLRHAAEIAEHWREAGEVRRALSYALLAGDQAMAVYAHVEANQHYRMAVEMTSALGDQAREAEALEKLATVLFRLARHQEALASIDAALVAYRSLGDVEAQSRVAENLRDAYLALGATETGVTRLEALFVDLDRQGLSQIGQARLYSALADVLARSGWLSVGEKAVSRFSQALEAAERAVALARAAGHAGVLIGAMLSWTEALIWRDRDEEALNALEELLPLAEAAGDLQVLAVGLVDAQVVSELHGEFALSQHYIDRGLTVVNRIGTPIIAGHLWFNQAELAFYRGDWAQARDAIARSLEIAQTYALGAKINDAHRYLSQLHLVAGERETANALIAEPLAAAEESHDLQALRMAYSHIAEYDLLEGRADAVCAYLEPLLDRPGLEEHQTLFVLPQYAWALLERGDEAAAEANALRCCQRARARHYHLWLVDGLRTLALVRQRQERWEDALELLHEAIALCRRMPYPYAEAKALYVAGQVYTTKGELERAREKYQAALAICERLGEGLYRPHIESASAALK
jgi:tetratricopeptide (TPR) repeat protein